MTSAFSEDIAKAKKALATLPRVWEGKKSVLEMKEADYNWRQMEWWAFYFEHLCHQRLAGVFQIPGERFGTVPMTRTGTEICSLLIDACRRRRLHSVHPFNKSLTADWLGLGSASAYAPLTRFRLMEPVHGLRPRTAIWWRLTPLGARPVEAVLTHFTSETFYTERPAVTSAMVAALLASYPRDPSSKYTSLVRHLLS